MVALDTLPITTVIWQTATGKKQSATQRISCEQFNTQINIIQVKVVSDLKSNDKKIFYFYSVNSSYRKYSRNYWHLLQFLFILIK